MRDRLIELLSKPIYPKIGADPAEVVADYLLDNGVIVPPCKVGDTLYYPYNYGNRVLATTVNRIVTDVNEWLDTGIGFIPFENIGKTVFLTREEAERALKERE